MGVYIDGFDMPKSCEECPIRIGETVGVYYDSKSDKFKRVKITGCNESKYHTKTLGEGYKMMYNDCPLIEIDIVRCGECKWGNKDNEGTLWCEHAIGGIMKPTDFCSYGERRADEHNIQRA